MTAVGSEVDALHGRGDVFYISLLNTSHRCAPPNAMKMIFLKYREGTSFRCFYKIYVTVKYSVSVCL